MCGRSNRSNSWCRINKEGDVRTFEREDEEKREEKEGGINEEEGEEKGREKRKEHRRQREEQRRGGGLERSVVYLCGSKERRERVWVVGRTRCPKRVSPSLNVVGTGGR